MKLRGEIGSQQVMVLVDSGATHNFISLELVRKLTLPVEETGAYGVLFGYGSVQGVGIYKQVLVRLQEIEIMEDFLPFDLTNSGIILGIQWLETLGNMQVNWKLQRMRFRLQGQMITIQGDPSVCRSKVSLKDLARAIKWGDMEF